MATGATLRQARVQKGLSLEGLAKATKVQTRVLDAIEREDHSQLPPRPYTRGMVAAFAREVGLDPDRTVRDYFADPGLQASDRTAPVPEVSRVALEDPPTRFGSSVLVVTAMLVAGIAVGWNLTGVEAPAQPQPVGTSGFAQPLAAVSTPEPMATDATPASREGLIVVLEASGRTWVAASADGKRVVYRVLQPGERETVRAASEIALRVGNAGAIAWTINGQSRGRMGDPGAVRSVAISPANASTVK